MGLRTRAAALGAALAAAVACEGPRQVEAALTPYEQQLADSAAADSAAFSALPDPLREFLDVRDALIEARATPPDSTRCRVLEPASIGTTRRRISFRFGDGSSAVLYAVAQPATGALSRVEYIRRVPARGQRGLIWDGERDRTTSTWWTETRQGLSRRVERGEIPRGGPVPRAMRGLGRQLMLVPCLPATDSTDPTSR
ncbi:MAG: hypothetical protein KF689_13455 [Gemmatimonadaceae bacterium]|nr:hypothetical protein [Gemmatimonadaceae bacterium]MCW5827008.1 hypothetical protein [Gemmatimonadaceae bacterium]